MDRWLHIYRRHKTLSWLVGIGSVSQLLSSTGVLPTVTRKDTAVHFVFSVLVSQAVFRVLHEFAQLKDETGKHYPYTPFGMVLLTFLCGTAIGCLWEVFEFSIDHIFGAHLQKSNLDTMTDLIADVLGSLTGGLLVLYGRQLTQKLRQVWPFRKTTG